MSGLFPHQTGRRAPGLAYLAALLPGCEHHLVNSWHVSTQEAVELVRLAEKPYTWRDQLRSELQGPVTRWMWPGLFALLLIAILIMDYLLIVASLAGIIFFMAQARSVVKAMREGKTIRAKCSEVQLVDEGKKTRKGKYKNRVWHAHTRFEGEAHEVLVTCPSFADAVEASGTVELLLIVDPGDADNHWLVAYRPLPEAN